MFLFHVTLKKKKNVLKTFISIKMLISSKLFIWRLSKRIARIEIAGKEAVIGKSWAVIGRKRVNEKAEKVLQKIDFLLHFFSVIKNIFLCKSAKFSYCTFLLTALGHDLLVYLCNIGTCSKFCCFMVMLSLLLANNTVQAFSGDEDLFLNRFVKSMFKWIFLSWNFNNLY